MTPPSTALTTLLNQFGLTTAAEELVPRLTQAGHHDALDVLLEVFEAEAEARRQRRAARLPPGKTVAGPGRAAVGDTGHRDMRCDGSCVELPQFRGHLSSWRGGGVHDAEVETAVPGGIPTADGRAGSVRTYTGRAGSGVRAVGRGDTKLGRAG